jgi:hypothetical protein
LKGYATQSWNPMVRVDGSTHRGLGWLLTTSGLVYHHAFTGTSLHLHPHTGRYSVFPTNALAHGRERLRRRDDRQRRRQVRQQRAVPVLKRFQEWLDTNRGLPKSPWGKAVNYALGQWAMLCRYAEDGRIEIDNNLVENAIRPIALGRKNYLFAGSHEAARRAAVIYSLVATCKKHEVNPYEWMSDVLRRIPTHPHKRVHELLPHRWKGIKV